MSGTSLLSFFCLFFFSFFFFFTWFILVKNAYARCMFSCMGVTSYILILCTCLYLYIFSFFLNSAYRIYPKFLDRQAGANSVYPNQILQNVVSDQSALFPSHQAIFCTLAGSKMNLFKFFNKYIKELRCPNT